MDVFTAFTFHLYPLLLERGFETAAVIAAMAVIGPGQVGGRIAIISFHSLEDRLVKRRFGDLEFPCKCPSGMPVCPCPPGRVVSISRRAVKVTGEERQGNPRSRSARMRAVRRVL